MKTWIIELITDHIMSHTVEIEAEDILKHDSKTILVDGVEWHLPVIDGLSFGRVEIE